MSLEQTSQTKDKANLFYDQVESGNVVSMDDSVRTSGGGQESRSDKNLSSTSKSTTTAAQKINIGFQLVFKVTLTNRTPFDPNHRC